MNNYINCIAHKSSEGNLLIGEHKTALFDCGMMFCAKDTIKKVKKELGNRPLDYIFATHTHYDHIGALPILRNEWPEVHLVTSDLGASVLLKDTPRRVIRELSDIAAKSYQSERNLKFTYSDDAFHADVIVKENDTIQLGGLTVETIETPGHTRDSLSFFVQELKLLILSETPGVLMPDGVVYPEYLTSFRDTIKSIEKCRRYPYQYLSLPHRGIISQSESNIFFNEAFKTTISCHDLIINLYKNGFTEDAILDSFYKKYYSDFLSTFQPEDAFLLNARATIAVTLREHKESLSK